MFKNFTEMAEMVKNHPVKKRIVLACAHDEHSLEAVNEAVKEGIVEAVLVGKEEEIKAIIKEHGFTLENATICNEDDDVEAAKTAVRLINEGKGDFLMKGRMQTADLLKQVVNKETGLNMGKVMSHVGLFEVPNYHKLVVLTDGGMLLHPTLEQKAQIIENAVDSLRNMGYENPKVAALCAAEKLNQKAPESVDAAALKEMNEKGELKGCVVEGPISYDIALSKEIADFKGFESPVAGDADVLLVPDMAAGNFIGKAWVIQGGGRMTGLVVGAKAPIVLTSRGSGADEKFYSIVFAAAASK
ncbi:phosphate acyltransferase [Mogibacterium timidum]|uniref:phosphate acyltransferase n=1 Tax=Mogibacterium timidum TaxID=35519 RepID=UPI0023570690|nr:phosphate acyltransferase [Mogibacterium timidum]